MTDCIYNGTQTANGGPSGSRIDSDARKQILDLLSQAYKIARSERLGMIEYLVSLVILEVRDTPEGSVTRETTVRRPAPS